jgi:hypothetical protein
MILTENDLQKWAESSFTPLNTVQRQAILERFATEPEPYEWTQQDIYTQIRNYIDCGEFVKSVQDSANTITLPLGIEF